ncbi:MAG: nucleotidyl transferase AbiEii/AbiGii toxin family protein [Nanoarchaeota archaeon]
MITKQELLDLTRISHFKPHQQEKHYIQTIILNSIYSTLTNELVFKGGTCLLFFYGLNRFSEDLDFTMTKDFDSKKLISNITKDLENIGINNKISNLKENSISLSFKIGVEGPLFNKEIERCFVKIDISKREEVYNFKILELKTNYKEIIGFTLNVMSEEEILAEKIRTLLTRNQARDLFDTYFLLNKNIKIDINLINKKLEYYEKTFNKKEFIKAVQNKEDIWLPELNPFILGEIPNFKEVKKYVLDKLSNFK